MAADRGRAADPAASAVGGDLEDGSETRQHDEVAAKAAGKPVQARAASPRPAAPSAIMVQLFVWSKALELVRKHSPGGDGGGKIALAIFVRTLALLYKAKVNARSTLTQNLGNINGFALASVEQIIMALIITLLSTWIYFAQNSLSLRWRNGLVSAIHDRYFARSNYFSIVQASASGRPIVDADIRIVEDVEALTTSISGLVVMALQGASDAAVFGFVMLRQGRRGLLNTVLSHVYSWGWYFILNYIIPVDWPALMGPMAAAKSKLQQGMGRAETHSEAICALQGGEIEHRAARANLRDSIETWKSSDIGQDLFDAVNYFLVTSYMDGTPLLHNTFFIYNSTNLQMEIRARRGDGAKLTDWDSPSPLVSNGWATVVEYNWLFMFATVASFNITTSLQTVLKNYAAITRIQELDARLSATDVSSSHRFEDSKAIRFENVAVQTPSGMELVRDLTFSIELGDSLLITGHNGVGKSSIFRCLGGLWPAVEGQIWAPGIADAGCVGLHGTIYYLAQRPYNAIGTLAQQLCYPDEPPASLGDAELRRWLSYVDLEYLTEKPGACTEEIDWQKTLSLGEQQRLGIVRLFYHRPGFAVVDESTSAVSGEMEKRFFELCAQLGISCVTVAHRPSLERYHCQRLNIVGPGAGGYTLRRLRAREELAIPHRAGNAHDIISTYFAGRGIRLTGERCAAVQELHARRSKLCSQEMDASARRESVGLASAPPRPGAMGSTLALLRLVLAAPGVRWRAASVAMLLAARPALIHHIQRTVARIVLAGIMFDQPNLLRHTIGNLVWLLPQFVLDRVTLRLTQELTRLAVESVTLHGFDLCFSKGAMHYAMALQPTLVASPAARINMLEGNVKALVGQLQGLVKPLFFAVYNFGVILSQGGPVTCAMALVLLAIHKVSSLYVMPNVSILTQKKLELEANFKTVHNRFRHNLEPIAFSGGGPAERRLIDRRFNAMVQHEEFTLRQRLIYNVCTMFLTQGDMLPLTVMRILSAMHVWRSSSALQSGGLSPKDFMRMYSYDRCSQAAFGTLPSIADLPASLAELEASSQTAMQLFDALTAAAAQAPTPAREACGPAGMGAAAELKVSGLHIMTPGNEALARGLEFEAVLGRGLLVTGPNGAGKSLLAKVLAGLRPPSGAHACVSVCGTVVDTTRRAHLRDLVAVTQQPYLAPASLATNISYPLPSSLGDHPEMERCLEVVGVSYLVERYGWYRELNWDEVLSGGEQQRLCMARCKFHRPAIALFDECTSMVSQDVERELYKHVVEAGVVPVTFSQRLSLPEHHSQHLLLGEETEKGWTLEEL